MSTPQVSPTDPVGIINASIIAINALLQVIANLKAQSGLTDEQLAARFAEHGPATQSAIEGYLANLPPRPFTPA